MKKYFASAVLSLGMLVSPAFTPASSLSSTQIQSILSLLSAFGADSATIANVTTALTGGTPTTSGTSFCHNFNYDLTVGNGGNEIEALNRAFAFSGIDTASNSSDFTESSAGDVVSFQAKYGIRQTGYVGPMTRAKLNALYGCHTGQQSTQTTTSTVAPTTVQATPSTTASQPTNTSVAPMISEISSKGQSAGFAVVGLTAYISGSNFDNNSYISIGNTPGGVNSRTLYPLSYSSTLLTFVIPSDMSVGTWSVYVAERGSSLVSNASTLTVTSPLPTCQVSQQTAPVYSNPFTITWSSSNTIYGKGPFGDKIDANGSSTYQLSYGEERGYTFTFYNSAGQSTDCSTFFSSVKG